MAYVDIFRGKYLTILKEKGTKKNVCFSYAKKYT